MRLPHVRDSAPARDAGAPASACEAGHGTRPGRNDECEISCSSFRPMSPASKTSSRRSKSCPACFVTISFPIVPRHNLPHVAPSRSCHPTSGLRVRHETRQSVALPGPTPIRRTRRSTSISPGTPPLSPNSLRCSQIHRSLHYRAARSCGSARSGPSRTKMATSIWLSTINT
jgi:hypothetical protein